MQRCCPIPNTLEEEQHNMGDPVIVKVLANGIVHQSTPCKKCCVECFEILYRGKVVWIIWREKKEGGEGSL